MNLNVKDTLFLESNEALIEYERLLRALDTGYDLDHDEMHFIDVMQAKLFKQHAPHPERHTESDMFNKDEWTQKELIENKKILENKGVEVVLVDTILKPIEHIKTIVYNPFELRKYKKGTVFVFYCYSGTTTRERLPFYRSKLPGYRCVSLRGGRARWRHTLGF